MIIAVENLHKSFGLKRALQGVTININSGQVYGLLGKNGAGKTTLLNCIVDILKPDVGTVSLFDTNYEIHSLLIKTQLGVLLDSNPLIEEFSGSAYLEFVARLLKLTRNEYLSRSSSVVSHFFDDPESIKKPIASFSTGMKKKLGLCAAMLHKPTLLILDEPFSGLDPITAKKLLEFIQLYREYKRTVLLSSHDLGYVDKAATHIGVLDDGKLLFDGTIDEFKANGDKLLDKALLDLLKPSNSDASALSWIVE